MFAGCVLAWPAPLAGGRGRPQGLLKHRGLGPYTLFEKQNGKCCARCAERLCLTDSVFAVPPSMRRKPQDLHVSNVKIWGMGPCPMFTQSPCPSRHGLCEHARTDTTDKLRRPRIECALRRRCCARHTEPARAAGTICANMCLLAG